MENNNQEKGFCRHCKFDLENCKCKRRLKFILILIAIFLAVLCSISYGVKKYVSYTNPRTIVITGKGEVNAVPDISTISFTARATSKEANTKTIQDELSKSISSVFEKLKALGIEEKDITTTSYSVNPKYEYENCEVRTMIYPPTPCSSKSVIVGYEATENVSIKVRNTDNVGKVLAVLAEEKITEVYGPNFEVDNIDALKDEARAEAIEDAKEKAKDLSKSLGVRIKRIISFSDDSGNMYMPMMYKAMSDSSAPVAGATREATIAEGEQNITSNVSITFQIED
ncbi:MAG: hypothetical protein RI945_205 [Candidatus Parcubacteria bacterium]|jgi:uncharacterized protein YggE